MMPGSVCSNGWVVSTASAARRGSWLSPCGRAPA